MVLLVDAMEYYLGECQKVRAKKGLMLPNTIASKFVTAVF